MLPKSTLGVSFRIPTETLKRLHKDADEKQVSLNTLANQIFAGYVSWDVSAAKAGWVVVQRGVLREILDMLDDEALQKIAKRTALCSKDARLMMFGHDSLEGFYTTLRNTLIKSGIGYREGSGIDGSRRFVIQHNMGSKWSLFFKTHYVESLNLIGHRANVQECTESTIVIGINET